MQQVVEAVYENGIFRPLKTPELDEGQAVQLIVHSKKHFAGSEMLQLASEVYQGLSDEQINDIEKIALDRQIFFREVSR